MSLEMHTYVPAADDALTPRWLARMKQLGMECEIHPGFSFATQSGFLPFKLRFHDSAHEQLNGVDFLTGFEFSLEDFDLAAALEARTPKPGVLGRLLGKKPQPRLFATAEIDEQLKRCRKLLTFTWGGSELFALRMATVSSAVLAELTGGLAFSPDEGVWYGRGRGAPQIAAEARAYENGVPPEELKFERFEGWL